MADTRRVVTLNHPADHTTWLELVATAYPRFYALLLRGRPVAVSDADWTTLGALDGWVDGSPMTAALTAVAAGSCEFERAVRGGYSNFPTLF